MKPASPVSERGLTPSNPSDQRSCRRKLHGRGGQFALADDSVHFFGYNINVDIFKALATRDKGEIVGPW